MDQAWLEWSEISPSIKDQLEGLPQQANGSAIHVFLPSCPLASVVLETRESHQDRWDDAIVVIRVHPVLFDFLNQLETSALSLRSSSSTTPTAAASFVLEQKCDGNQDDFDIPVKLGPLPMQPQYSAIPVSSPKQSWHLSWMKVHEFPRQGGEICLSCIYMDPDLWNFQKNTSSEAFLHVIQNCLLGRLVQQHSIVLVAYKFSFAILEVSQIQCFNKEAGAKNDSATGAPTNESSPVAYRLPRNADQFIVHVEFPQRGGTPAPNSMNKESIWESHIPGYDPSLLEITEIMAMNPKVAAPTGILLTGVPGVGKSRLGSCIAYTMLKHEKVDNQDQSSTDLIGSEENNLGTVFCLSVQELLFQATTESDIFENILAPSLRTATLWILDDLHLLEREDSGEEGLQIDAEFTAVYNAVVQAIDEYQSQCFIIGICQVASKLPPGLGKNGRLEKQISMLPPTQNQRIAIWNYLLRDDVPTPTTRQAWSEVLANNTAGCVAADLVRVHQDAWTRCWARSSEEEEPCSANLEWKDLQEATRSCIPSQLAELDVIKSTVFDSGLDWKQIHQESWKAFGGYDKFKRDVFRQVVMPWKMFLKRCDDGAEPMQSWIDPPPGVLFYGESGCGKTEAVRCLATSMELSMIQVRASDVLDKWLGGSEALLRSLFMRARAAAPCILFIDEIDSIACNRAEGDTDDSSSRILSTLLNEMDGVSSDVHKSKIIVVACTNRLEALDAALLRPGRLQEHFAIDLPNCNDLKEILNLYLAKVPLDDDVSIEEMASSLYATEASGATVVGICREACLSALRRGCSMDRLFVSKSDFMHAMSS